MLSPFDNWRLHWDFITKFALETNIYIGNFPLSFPPPVTNEPSSFLNEAKHFQKL